MADLLALPAEIKRQCFNYLSGASLKSVRLTSKALADIATEALFALVTINVTVESARRFTTLIKNASIRRCIRTVGTAIAHPFISSWWL